MSVETTCILTTSPEGETKGDFGAGGRVSFCCYLLTIDCLSCTELGKNHCLAPLKLWGNVRMKTPHTRHGGRSIVQVVVKETQAHYAPEYLCLAILDPRRVELLSSFAAGHRDDLRFLCSQYRV